MTSAERPEPDALEQRQEIVDNDELDLIEPDTGPDAELGPEVDAADAAEQRHATGALGEDEDYPPA